MATASAAASAPSDQRSSIAAERMAPAGFALPVPAISGALPWIGSYSPNRVPGWVPALSLTLAEGNTPMDPGMTEASSVRMSPNMFSVTMTSK